LEVSLVVRVLLVLATVCGSSGASERPGKL
jgi:hypothetical protein